MTLALSNGSLKYNLCLEIRYCFKLKIFLCALKYCCFSRFVKQNFELGEEQQSDLSHLTVAAVPIYNIGDFHRSLDQSVHVLANKLDVWTHNGSGWAVQLLKGVHLNFYRYRPLSGSTYLKTPQGLIQKRAINNIKNKDNRCFLWSVLSAIIQPSEFGYNSKRKKQFRKTNPHKYAPFINRVQMGDISYPVKIGDLPKFERLNPQLSVNVLGEEHYYCCCFKMFHIFLLLGVKADCLNNGERSSVPEITPLYISKEVQRPKQVHLLLISDQNPSHYTHIKNLNGLLTRKGGNNSISICLNCFHKFYGPERKQKLKEHQDYCFERPTAKIAFPKQKFIKFENIRAQKR